MKILVIWTAILLTFQEASTPGYISGGMKRMSELISNWQKAGTDVTVITTDAGILFLKREGINCKVLQLKEPFFFQSLISKKVGVSLVYCFRIIQSFFSLRSFLSEDYDVVSSTSHYLPDIFLLSIFSFFSRGKAYFVHLYHVFPLPFEGAKYESKIASVSNWVQQIIGFELIRHFKILTFQSQRSILERYGFKGSNIFSIGMGLNLSQARESLPLNERFDGIFLGRLTRKKGIFDLLNAWNEVLKVLPDCTLCLAGQTSSERIEDTIKLLGLTGKVTLFGVVSGTRKYSLLKSGNVFVFPSYEEGWGVVVSEALSCGLPAVVYDLPAYDVFGSAVVKVPMGDVKQFAEQVVTLLKDEKKRSLMKKAAFEESSSLDWEFEAGREMQILKTCSEVE